MERDGMRILDPYNPDHQAEILDLLEYELDAIQNNVDIQNAYPMPRSPQDSLHYAIAHCLYGDPRRGAAELRKLVHEPAGLIEKRRATLARPVRSSQLLPSHYRRAG